ncbi:MAG: endonuclease/exonuclease/phosphatase family protein [Paludibacter sp.]|jgi:endonuclease/exonuclease/phosphatase family metal-dependent hydrolase|nr:endonuclease/exonuclease/phosphatase family protein [Paludibacter sp.]
MKQPFYFLSLIILLSLFIFPSCKSDELEEYLPEPTNNLSGDTLRFISYNVYHFGKNPEYPNGNYGVIANILKDLKPDVVCLQELDSMTTRTNRVYQIKQLAELNSWNFRFASTIPSYQEGSYGIGVVTPRSFSKSSYYQLTSTDEQRGFLIAEFPKYIVVCTHFGGDEATRKLQAQELTAKIKELFGSTPKPIFLGGDLNSTPVSDTMKELYKSWILISGQENTIPGGNKCIDYILMLNQGNKYKVLESKVIGTSPFGNMQIESDHYPVMVTIIIP